MDSGLRPQGVNQRWGADIYRLAPIVAVCKMGVNLPEDLEQSVRSPVFASTPACKHYASARLRNVFGRGMSAVTFALAVSEHVCYHWLEQSGLIRSFMSTGSPMR